MSNTGTDTRQRNPSPGKIRGRRPFIPQREGRISPAGKTDNVAPHMKYEVILYYYFHPIRNPEQFCKRHRKFLRELDVKGRVYINEEGINGTLGGTPEQMESYNKYLKIGRASCRQREWI